MVKLSWAFKRIFHEFPYLRFLPEEQGEGGSGYFSGYTVYLGLAKKNYYPGNSEIFCFAPASLYTLCTKLLKSGKTKVNIASLAKEVFEPLRRVHVHRDSLAVETALAKLEEELRGQLNFDAWKNPILGHIESGEYNKAVYLLNHFFLRNEQKKLTLHSLYLDSFTQFNNGTITNKIDNSKAFFNVLLIDDFALLHIYQMAVLETQFLAGVGTKNTLAPVIHFDFECLPENFERKIKQKEYDLILMDIDFGELKPNTADLIKKSAKQKIPVIMFSKYEKIKDYEKFMGGTIGAIHKDKTERDIFLYLWKRLMEEHKVDSYIYKNKWLILNSEKLKKIGIYNLGNIKIEELKGLEIPFFETSEKILEETLKMLKNHKNNSKEETNYKLILLPKEKNCHLDLELIIIGKVPDFIKKPKYPKPKYLKTILESFDNYGISYGNVRSEIDREHGIEIDRIIVKNFGKENLSANSILFSDPQEDPLIGFQMDLNYIVVPSFSPLSLSDIIGPVTIGPSSSHTAGANRMARLTRNFCSSLRESLKEKINQIVVEMVNSFYDTGEGHGSDKAIAAGLLGFRQYDEKLPKTLKNPGRAKESNVINGKISGKCDGKIDLNKKEIDVKFCWNKNADPDIHNNSVKFHIYLGNFNSNWNGKNKNYGPPLYGESRRKEFVLTFRSWGGGNIQLSGIKSPYTIVSIEDGSKKVDNINEKEKIFRDSELDPEKNFLSGKTNIILTIERNNTNGEIKIINIFSPDSEAIKYAIQRNKPIIVESPMRRDSFNGEFQDVIKKIKSEEKRKKEIEEYKEKINKYKNEYEWIKAEGIGEGKSIIRPEFLTLDDLLEIVKQENKPLQQIAFEYERHVWSKLGMKISESFLCETFKIYRKSMLDTIEKGINHPDTNTDYRISYASDLFLKSKLFEEFFSFTSMAVLYSIAVNEVSAKMIFSIVAAPTAGSCGIIPGVMKAIDDKLVKRGFNENEREKIETDGLIVAALVGLIINNTVEVSGAKYGCQAECGTGAAMAASMAAFILGGSPEDCIHAATIALKNSLGLVCDPLEGKVEVPCIKRSGMKAGEALEAAFLALNGVRSEITPSDVVRAMKEIGDNMLLIYKETSKGGLALTRKSRRRRSYAGYKLY